MGSKSSAVKIVTEEEIKSTKLFPIRYSSVFKPNSVPSYILYAQKKISTNLFTMLADNKPVIDR